MVVLTGDEAYRHSQAQAIFLSCTILPARALSGTDLKEAYFVRCDAETTTQNDRNLGIVNIWVGFAPLKPAEFVILYLQQMAGQIET